MKKSLLFLMAFAGLQASAQSWTAGPTGYTSPSHLASGISIPNANVAWTKASNTSTPANTVDVTHIWSKTTDGGQTWTTGSIAGIGVNQSTSISSIASASATKAWVSAFQGSGTNLGGIYHTSDGGTTWTRQTTASFNLNTTAGVSFPNLVYFWNENNGICQGDPTSDSGAVYFEIYVTSNGGTNWTRVTTENIPAPLENDEYGYTNNFAVAGNRIWFGTSKGRLFRSDNMGATWQAFQTPSSDFDSSTDGGNYAFADANNGILIKSDTTVHKTTDGGQTWTTAPYTGIIFSSDLKNIPGTNTYVSTGLGPAGSSMSLDGGTTWVPIDTAPHGVTAFLNADVGYSAGVNAGALVTYKWNGDLKVDEIAAGRIKLVPNPTNGPLQLTGVSISKVEMFDLTGKKVMSQNFEAIEDLTLDVSALQIGAYILQATATTGAKESVRFLKK